LRFYLESQLENLKRFTEYNFIQYKFPLRELFVILFRISTRESQEIHKIQYFSIWVSYKRTLWDHTEGPHMSTLTLFSIDASIRSQGDLSEASQLRFLLEISWEKPTWGIIVLCLVIGRLLLLGFIVGLGRVLSNNSLVKRISLLQVSFSLFCFTVLATLKTRNKTRIKSFFSKNRKLYTRIFPTWLRNTLIKL